ncbi:MAG: hypothetical protein L0Z50_04575 [Verrucomicrobiales bacterium]|nr:hypothetical protein [Verrucomicrobiales bacterium]
MSRNLQPSTFLAPLLLFLSAGHCHAQWLTESFALKSGWNAVYLHVDAAHDTLDNLVGSDVSNQIQEIWMWSPNPSAAQFVTSPQSPATPTYWLNWVRSSAPSATLTRLTGNAACLVRSAADYTWTLKGKPVGPDYRWSSSGLNFIGFPTPPGAAAPAFDTFFTPAPELKVGAEIFAYRGGAITANPVQIFDQTITKVNRGEAFWIRSPEFNRYFGPFDVQFSSSTGARFGDAIGQVSFRLRNTTDNPLTVTLTGAVSEAPPAGQAAILGQVPVLVRGEIDLSTLTFTHSPLSSGPKSWALAQRGQVGSDIEVVLGVDRSLVTGTAGQLYASVLRFTDSLNYAHLNVPVSATVGSTAGLWVGGASVSAVSHYLSTYAKATNATELAAVLTRLALGEGVDGYHYEIDPTTSKILVFGGPDNRTGSYLLDGPIKLDSGTVARPFPLRLILHYTGTTARLLQKVFFGIGLSSTPVVATKESLLLPAELARARRISSVNFPTSDANVPWDFTGAMAAGSSLSVTLNESYDDQSSNPFLHTYHPDHDNLDAKFATVLAQGAESYGARRQITLNFTGGGTDFNSLTRSGSQLSGDYVETLTFLGKSGPTRQFDVRGTFTLNRISDIATLTQ